MTVRSNTQQRYYTTASEVYATQLRNSQGSYRDCAIGYLTDHGVTGEIAAKYKLGLVAEPLAGDERFQGALSVPYLTPNGVAAIKFRLFGQDAKMGQHKGQKARLYNTRAYFEARDVIGLAEGEVDAIAATEHLGLPTMGGPGADSWKDIWTPLMKDFTKVFIFADGDAKGSVAWQKPLDLAERIGWRAQVIRCPEGEDVSSLAAKSELGIIREVISTSNREES